MIKAARIALAPVWVLQLFSGTKSFRANGLIGSALLNRLGLHVVRKVLAHGFTSVRRGALSGLAPRELRRSFRRDGYVAVPDFLPADQFEALRAEARALAAEPGVRQLQEGDTFTRLALLDDEALARAPQMKRFLEGGRFLGLVNYCGARLKLPFCQVQVLRRDFAANESDPQKDLHSDTFHPTLKGWFFLEDVDPQKGPFEYVPGSHRLTRKRLAWEYRQSLKARRSPNPHVSDGSFRIRQGELGELGLPEPMKFAVPANTLVLADTAGFHRRGQTLDGSERMAVYIFMRTNPFNPILGFRSRAWRKMELMALRMSRGRRAQTPSPKAA
jgi:hypothetical protein